MNSNKNILRGVIVLSYVLIIALVIYGIAAIFSYLNTGADRSKMLHTEVKQTDHYLPELTWAPLANEGRPIDEENLKAIENDYLDAWYVKHVAFMTNAMTGIDDFYTKSARENIRNIISINSENTSFIEATTLAHHPTLEFFSEDGQLAVLTDHNVIEFKRMFNGERLVAEINEKSTYKVTLLLEDGFWRIRHLVRIKSEPYTPDAKQNPITISEIKGINYYPQVTPWDMFGANFDADTIASDFQLIASSGLNSIRVFVPYDSFGKASVDNNKLSQLITLLDLAETANLKVMVTLFDFYGDYSVINWSLTQRHAKTIVNALKYHNALLGWDIKNEPNLDFENRTEPLILAWLDKMVDFVKSEDPSHPITIGWSNAESSLLLKDKLDFVSFHYYEDIDALDETYKALKTEIPDKPIVISEFGLSSYSGLWNPLGNSEEDQAEYHQAMQVIFLENDIQFMSWTLYDFIEIPKEVVGRLPWRQNAQKHFGFIDESGIKKPSFKYISTKG
ncbi:cellulase family glycosylhydrolase [Ichthyenterobacterium sp. W332]|uniref:Cellulase family glycosylhydrolase n=1 Tax=Microcosmobacter mediterraneus TaxID=3075607 RepID=A0ABU2YP10_9FLAO|nr:glycoside hydrolase family 2 TIM barrel-domain containing protein [Ichthyenterobacterium sp. W332]MDT0558985.1 cellulase family glycosylhydrolase [Ichthyenterobacterium sp. W332]